MPGHVRRASDKSLVVAHRFRQSQYVYRCNSILAFDSVCKGDKQMFFEGNMSKLADVELARKCKAP